MRNNRNNGRRLSRAQRGGALLAVLWLCAGLSAIAFSVASTVRGETERAATAVEALRAYYIAAGAVERASLWLQWGPGPRNPDGSPRFYEPGMPRIFLQFPGGDAVVDIIPESAKLNINSARPEELLQLMLALGVAPDRAQEIAAAIVDWRGMLPPGASGPFDQFYLLQTPSFRARHASFREIEELLFVKGMTPDIYYGSYARDPQGRLVPKGALKDCVSVYGAASGFDFNTVEPPLLAAEGFSPEFISLLLEMRRQGQIRGPQFEALVQSGGPAARRLVLMPTGSAFTLRATARARTPDGHLSELRRSVAALVRINNMKEDTAPFRVLRWYDNAWADTWGQQQ